jgi:hypothetical protein
MPASPVGYPANRDMSEKGLTRHFEIYYRFYLGTFLNESAFSRVYTQGEAVRGGDAIYVVDPYDTVSHA